MDFIDILQSRDVNDLIDFLKNNPNIDLNADINPLVTPLIAVCMGEENEEDEDISVTKIRILVHHGADVNKPNYYVYTALMYACLTRGLKTIKELIKLGANVNLRNRYGNSALTIICMKPNSMSIIKELLKHGAEITPKEIMVAQTIPVIGYLQKEMNKQKVLKLLVTDTYRKFPETSSRKRLKKDNIRLLKDYLFSKKKKKRQINKRPS